MERPQELIQCLQAAGQDHLWTAWESLPEAEQQSFLAELQTIDLAQLQRLYEQRNTPENALPKREKIRPLTVLSADDVSAETTELGAAAFRAGQVAVLLVAGGQGTRLGFDHPKGMFPVGPLTGASLFQIHAEKVLALSNRYGVPIPFLIMTSSATHDETFAFFAEHHYFGLAESQVHFFQQGTMPALDLQTGQLILSQPGQLFLSPNGHGGTLTALAESGLLAKLKHLGIQQIYYFQVDNALVNIGDCAFLGQHIQTQSEVSSKVVYKERPEEKVGILAEINGRCGIIEYSDMPKEMNEERNPDGTLTFRAGNPAIHLFRVDFLEEVTSGTQQLQFHLARKKVPYWDSVNQQIMTPAVENALKFELFIFDALPMAERWLAMETRREDEFAPLKNATGHDSPDTVLQLQLQRNIRWLRQAGVAVADDAEVEISPLFALDADELKSKLPASFKLSPRHVFQ